MRRVGLRVCLILPMVLAINASLRANDVGLSEPQVQKLEIETRVAAPASAEPVAFLPAVVVPPLSGRIAIAAPYAGTVVNATVLPGQVVKKGEPLVTIASRELIEAQSRLKQAEADLQAAEAVARRYRALADQHIANATRAEEAEAQVEKVRAMVEQTRRLVALSDIKLNPDGSYSLNASSGGRVVETRVTPGGSLEAMAPAVVIDTTDELWVKAQIPASLIERIKPGDAVQVTNGPAGTVLSVGGALDPVTRSATLFASLPRTSKLVAGQMVTITVQQPPVEGSLEVPASSVVWMNGRTFVFVKVEGGFSVRAVTVRGRTPQTATIEGDLKPGQQVAFTGLAQLEKMASGD